MKRAFYLGMFFIVLLVSYGCAKPAAEVNGDRITLKAFKAALAENMQQHAVPGKDVKESQLKDAVIQQLIGEKLLLQAAKEKNIAVSPEEVNAEYERMITAVSKEEFNKRLRDKGMSQEEFKAKLKDQLTVRKLVDSLVPPDSVAEKEMKEFYKETPKMFIRQKQVMVRLIQTGTEDAARKIMADMKEKKLDFDAVAEKLRKEGSKDVVVTDYGWTESTFYSPEIAEALQNLKKGSYGGPYKGKDGFYLLRVKDKKEESPMTFDEAKDQIRAMLLNQKRQSAVAHLISERKKNAVIKINIS